MVVGEPWAIFARVSKVGGPRYVLQGVCECFAGKGSREQRRSARHDLTLLGRGGMSSAPACSALSTLNDHD